METPMGFQGFTLNSGRVKGGERMARSAFACRVSSEARMVSHAIIFRFFAGWHPALCPDPFPAQNQRFVDSPDSCLA